MTSPFVVGVARSMMRLGAAVALIVSVGCGAITAEPVGQGATSARTASPSATVGASPISTVGWRTYSSPKWAYSIEYPPVWLQIPNHGAPDTETYFSNENVGPPDQMDANGIYVAISVNRKTDQGCPLHGAPSTSITKQDQLTVDGVPATLSEVGGQLNWELYLDHAGYCYRFAYINHFDASQQVVDSTEAIAVAMLGTFKFGIPNPT